MKYLLQQMAKYFDEYQVELNKSWLDEYSRVQKERSEGISTKFELAKVMEKQPKINIEKFTQMFTDAEDRIRQSYANNKSPKTGLFGKKTIEVKEQ